MAPYTSPGTVLKTAESLIAINQPHAALATLSETFSSKRFRSTPLPSLEPVVLKFIELCVELRKGRTAKEGLMQFKNVAQAVDVNSIVLVINKFIQLAEQKLKDAGGVDPITDIDDLEASETPESILLALVSSPSASKSTQITPFLKFLWEAYRSCLEVLKNSARLEPLYQQIARQAFQFCVDHSRKVEFRRLCDILRLHLSNVTKYAPPPGSTLPQHANAINLNDPAVLQSHLDTRLVQLKIAVELELWQEAFRSLEDVHHLLLLSSSKDPSLGLASIISAASSTSASKDTIKQRQQRLSMLANYYQKCTRIFLMSGSHLTASGSSGGGGALFHAAAWMRYWTVIQLLDSPTPQEELQSIAAQVVVSALAVPVTATTPTAASSQNSGKTSRLTSLLGLTTLPTRKALLAEAVKQGGPLSLSPPAVKKLYHLLVVEFDPLGLGTSVAKVLDELPQEGEEVFKPYVPLLERAVLSRLIKHLGEVYESIKLDNVYELVEPLGKRASSTSDEASQDGLFTPPGLEAYIISSARRGEIGARIDHWKGALVFIDEAYSTTTTFATASGGDNEPSDDTLQTPLSNVVQTRVSSIGVALSKSLAYLGQLSQEVKEKEEEEQEERFKRLIKEVEAERKSLLLKRALIQRRRELKSELNVRQEAEENAARAERLRREREEREIRELQERRKREEAAKRREIEEIKKKEMEKQIAPLIEQGVITEKDVAKITDTKDIVDLQVTQFERTKKEMNTKLKLLAKKIDHTERAYRMVARPLLASDYTEQLASDKEAWEKAQEARKKEAKKEWERALQDKSRLGRMRADYDERVGTLLGDRKKRFDEKKKEAERRLEKAKEERRNEVRKRLEEEQKSRDEEERRIREEEEEERRLEEERLAEEERVAAEAEAEREAEEQKKRETEAAAAAAREQREKERAAAAEQARRQREREEEAEARRAARKLESQQLPPRERERPSSLRPSAGGEGGSVWRRSALRSESGTPNTSQPSTPVRATTAATPPERSESPAPGKYRPGQGLGGGWRAREDARKTGGAAAPGSGANTPAGGRSQSPTPAPAASQDDDGFTTVTRGSTGGTWKRGTGRWSTGRS